MCTALTFKTKDHYFGRNLDLEYSLGEQVVITPRNYVFNFRMLPTLKTHYAMIGVAKIDNGFPLYYDATNEAGLSIAGLNFPENAVYFKPEQCLNNIAPFEIIPYILGKFKSVREVSDFLKEVNISDIAYNDDFPLSPLHWIIADEKEAITVESVKDGLKIYENSIGILTNNPPFCYQMFNLNNYAHISACNPEKNFSKNVPYSAYSRGLGGLGLPGDFSSMSRFVRAVFAKSLSVCDTDDMDSISQFFHILSYVEQVRGCVKVNDKDEITVYSSCCNATKGIYYYSTYQNRCIRSVDMHKENLDSDFLIPFDMTGKEFVFGQN
ncbi:MAG: choloylglycine hydrolase [Clostridia bacterium]|nr:choloylglycine hydrolase [Clostridia bacterium]